MRIGKVKLSTSLLVGSYKSTSESMRNVLLSLDRYQVKANDCSDCGEKMAHFKFLFILSACLAKSSAAYHRITKKNQSYNFNGIQSPSETYSGPSSYTTSFGGDYPGFGNFGAFMNMRNPQISSSYSSFGPSSEGSSEFGSTSYVNYPPTVENESPQPQYNSIFTPNQNHPALSGFYSSQSSSPNSYQNDFKSSQNQPMTGYSSGQGSSPNDYHSDYYKSTRDSFKSSFSSQTSQEETPISQHVEITKPIVVPVYKKFPYAVSKRFPVAIPHPILVPVPAPYPVNVDISQPVAIPVIREIRIPIEREVMYPVEKHVPVVVEKPVQYQIEKHYPVYKPYPYPVKVPIVKTVIHKSPKKW